MYTEFIKENWKCITMSKSEARLLFPKSVQAMQSARMTQKNKQSDDNWKKVGRVKPLFSAVCQSADSKFELIDRCRLQINAIK